MHQHVCDWHDKYGQRLPFPGRAGGEMVHRGANCHWGAGQDFTQDADFLSLPSLHSFSILSLPAQTPWGLFWWKASAVWAHTRLLGDENEDALFIPAQPSHHGPIHSHPNAEVLGVGNDPCGVQKSSCSTDTSSYPLHDRSVANFSLLSHPFFERQPSVCLTELQFPFGHNHLILPFMCYYFSRTRAVFSPVSGELLAEPRLGLPPAKTAQSKR